MSHARSTDSDAADILRFYAEAGVDIALSEAPVDRFALARAGIPKWRKRIARSILSSASVQTAGAANGGSECAWPTSRPAAAPSRRTPMPPNLAVPSEAAVMAAREAAATADTLEALRATLETFEGCNLRFTATNLVFADGNPEARAISVAGAPGMEEDLQGLPFVGRSGRLLDRMIAAIGLDRNERLHHQRRPVAATRQPRPEPAGKGDLPSLHPAADPARRSGYSGAPRRRVGEGHSETTRESCRLRGQWRSYNAGRQDNHRDGDIAPRLSSPPAAAEETGMAGLAGR